MKISQFWAGTEESFDLVMKAEMQVEALLAKPGMTAGYIDDMIAKLPPIAQHIGSVAVIDVNGPLVQGSAGIGRLFGVVGYDDIAQAAVDIAAHPDTQAMLWHINTPGGDVAGITDMSGLIGTLSALKPSAVHTSELMASAGYWMGSAVVNAKFMSAGPTAVVGSVGVLRVVTNTAGLDEKLGVKRTVLRAGQYKAEINPIEPLTEEAKARAESQMAEVHSLFKKQVAAARPKLAADQINEVTQGQTFLGQQAVKAGLVDKIQSFDLALKLLDRQKSPSNTLSHSKGKAMAITLTPEQLAQIAAGKTLAQLGMNEDGSPMSAEQLAARDADTARNQASAEMTAIKAELETTKGQLTTVQASLTTVQAELTTAKAEVATSKAKITDLEKVAAHHEGLVAIAKEATAKMLIPMGGTQATVDGMDAAAVIAEHARIKPLFLEKFPAGRQSQASEDDQREATKVTLPLGFEFAVKNAPSANR